MIESRLRPEDYSIGWICALPSELAAAEAMLDHKFDSPSPQPQDDNVYILGQMLRHNIVLTCLPAGQYGTTSAARVVSVLRSSFPSLRFALLVGIGGGVPSERRDVRLGDVVVSRPSGWTGGVVQYDFGKTSGSMRTAGLLNAPPRILLSAITNMNAAHEMDRSKVGTFLSRVYQMNPRFKKRADPGEPDLLFKADYVHNGDGPCISTCDMQYVIQRRPRPEGDGPHIHFGTIASINHVLKSGTVRDQISAEIGDVLCFDMEAAGVMNYMPCLVVRGICDYSDSHNNRRWQFHAALTAAAVAKEILSYVPPADVAKSHAIWDVTELHKAAEHGAIETARQLLQNGADPNAKDSNGCTPLHYATRNGQIEIVRLLFHWGVDESITDASGKSAKDLARDNGHTNVSVIFADPPIIVSTEPEEEPEQGLQECPFLEDRCEDVCKIFDARVELNYRDGESRALYESYRSIYDLLYGERDGWGEISAKWEHQMQINARDARSAMRWIHLPANNMLWIKDVIKRLCHSDGKARTQCSSILRFVDEHLYEHTEPSLHACYREPSWHTEDDMISLVLPYIDMESEQYLNRNSESQSEHVKNMHKLIAQYKVTSDIHVSRTLDQSYYYVIDNTKVRDHDQVVYRDAKRKRLKKLPAGEKAGDRLLMVNQLWLWKIDERTIITAFPERWHEGAEPKVLSAILKSRPYLTPKAVNWITHVVHRCITFSEEPNNAGLDERYSRIFARAIAAASDLESHYYSKFTDAISKGLVTQIDIEEEIKLLQEIKDIRDELNMLNRVLADQLDVVKKISKWADRQMDGSHGYEWGAEARLLKIKRMDEDAERVEKSLNHLLDFKQKQSNIEEAKLARRQAEDTTLQSKYIFIFTIVTVIFTPLSFMAALFAIQIKEFPHDDKGLNFDGVWIGKYMAAGEITTIALVVIATTVILAKGSMKAFFQRRFGKGENDSDKKQVEVNRTIGKEVKLNVADSVENSQQSIVTNDDSDDEPSAPRQPSDLPPNAVASEGGEEPKLVTKTGKPVDKVSQPSKRRSRGTRSGESSWSSSFPFGKRTKNESSYV